MRTPINTTLDSDEDKDDEDYCPPKRQHDEPPSPSHVFDSEGEEIAEDNDCAVELVSILKVRYWVIGSHTI